MTRSRRFAADTSGATAIEFALLSVPFLLIVTGLLEIGVEYFTATTFEAAVQRTSRLIRTGQAQTSAMTPSNFRADICDYMLNMFDCSENTSFSVTVISSLDSVPTDNPVDSSGNFSLTEDFDIGEGSDYVLVRGYFQFAPPLDVFGVMRHRLANGSHLLSATALFRNEPF